VSEKKDTYKLFNYEFRWPEYPFKVNAINVETPFSKVSINMFEPSIGYRWIISI